RRPGPPGGTGGRSQPADRGERTGGPGGLRARVGAGGGSPSGGRDRRGPHHGDEDGGGGAQGEGGGGLSGVGARPTGRGRVAAPDAPSCKVGNSYRFVVDEVPGQEFKGKVARIAEMLDAETRTMRAEGQLENASGALRPGMFGRLVLDLETHEGALVLPSE